MDRVTFGGPMDRVLLLRTMPMFEGLGPVQLAAIAQHSGERVVSRGSTVHASGNDDGSALLVVEGELEEVGAESRRSYTRGDSAGFVELLAGTGNGISLTARVDTLLLELDWDAQLDVCEEHFAVIMSYVGFLASRLVERTQKLEISEHGPVPLIASQRFGRPLDFNQRLLLLSRSNAFSPGSLDALSELSAHAEEVRLGEGRRVWSAGQEAGSFILVAEGALRLDDRSGRSAIYRAGMAAGMAETLSPYHRRFSATTVEPTTALRIQVESFMDILEDHFDLSLDVMSTLARRLLAAGPPEPGYLPAGDS